MNFNLATADSPTDFNKPYIAQLARRFPTWHFHMMNDAPRNEAIEGCIRDADVAGKTIFEIGTGAGLTAMLFAKHGAKKVITCESDEQMFSIAQKTISRNQLSKKIDCFFGTSSEYLDKKISDTKPDIIFTETLDCGVIGEGFHHISRDIQRIFTENISVFPQHIFQNGYMIESEEIYSLNSVESYRGIDLSETNAYSTQNYFPVRLTTFEAKSLSDTNRIKTYSYTKPSESKTVFSSTAYRTGTCHGILSFFHAFYGSHVVSNDTRDKSHWHQAFHPLRKPFIVAAGKNYEFSIDSSGFVSALSEKE